MDRLVARPLFTQGNTSTTPHHPSKNKETYKRERKHTSTIRDCGYGVRTVEGSKSLRPRCYCQRWTSPYVLSFHLYFNISAEALTSKVQFIHSVQIVMTKSVFMERFLQWTCWTRHGKCVPNCVLKITVLWNVVQCSLLASVRLSAWACCLDLAGNWLHTRCHIPAKLIFIGTVVRNSNLMQWLCVFVFCFLIIMFVRSAIIAYYQLLCEN